MSTKAANTTRTYSGLWKPPASPISECRTGKKPSASPSISSPNYATAAPATASPSAATAGTKNSPSGNATSPSPTNLPYNSSSHFFPFLVCIHQIKAEPKTIIIPKNAIVVYIPLTNFQAISSPSWYATILPKPIPQTDKY